MKLYEACSVVKVKQENVRKDSDHELSKGNYEQTFLYISSVIEKNYGPPVQLKRHWRIMVDERTKLKFTKLFSINNGIIEPNLE